MKTFWNFLTVIVILLIMALVIWGVLIYINPHHFLNPFPPARPESQVLVGWLRLLPWFWPAIHCYGWM